VPFTRRRISEGVGTSTFWISRVPDTIKEAGQLLESDVGLKPCKDPRHSYFEIRSDYAGIPQKWILVNSKEMQKSMTGTFEKKLSRELDATQKSFVHLRNQEFFCTGDALKAAQKWLMDHPFKVRPSLHGGCTEEEWQRQTQEERASPRTISDQGGDQDRPGRNNSEKRAAGQIHHRHQRR